MNSIDHESCDHDDECLFYHGKRHVEELLRRRGAIHQRRVVQLAGHRLQAGQEEDHGLAHHLPQGRCEQGQQAGLGVGEPRLGVVDAQRLHQGVDEAKVGVVHPAPDDGHRNGRHHAGEVEHAAEKRSAAEFFDQHQRKRQSQRGGHHHRQQYPDQIVPEGRLEHIVLGEQADIVGNAHRLHGLHAVPLVEADVDRIDQGDDNNGQIDDSGGCQKGVISRLFSSGCFDLFFTHDSPSR